MPITMPFSSSSTFKKNTATDLRVDIPHMANGMQAYNSNSTHNGMGSGNVPNSPAPFIKNEPQDESSRFLHQAPYHHHHPDAYSMPGHQQFHQQGGFNEPNYNGGDGSIDPSELTMSPSMPIQQNGGFIESYPNYSSGNNNVGYMGSGGAVDDEDLLALGNLDERHVQNNGQFGMDQHQEQRHGHGDDYSSLHHLFPEMEGGGDRNAAGENGTSTGSTNIDQMYSHTPDNNPPAESPFIHSFPPQQFRQLQHPYNGATADTPSSYNASPVIGSDSTQGTNFDQYMATGKRKSGPVLERNGTRKSPNSRSPHTPKTPGIGSLSIGGESSSVPAQPIQTSHMASHRHHKSLSNQWDGTPGSQISYIDSPLSSPGASHVHPQISDVFKSGKHASLPAKVENQVGAGPAFQTQEAKRRRRRESHNMVERRRRDNINERIQELSHLVPQHRLEDEKVRKHLVNNGSLSPSVGPSGSPPRATSMLAGGVGRRASGVPTSAGLTGEEKDKGPNKGDILNGAVGWTRDLMWALHAKLEQEKEIRELVVRLGGTYPFEQNEDEKRMSSELYSAVEKNGVQSFHYSRAPGSTLRVPGYTDYAGNAVGPGVNVLSPRVSPSCSGGKPSQNGGSSRGTPQQQSQFWNQNSDGMAFKEEDEYNSMDMS
ncbi:hypothetical protein L873DRAFT_1828037 [Choiromyces venosus 120613-1]|uniref:BHLH domain-containing protein n=1 Tax=Choiromyces venosus 120613-1 TaxID=1336337 RepID=A0A3N4JT32_9PEZI|nr:hypothetical protein L873DRAFT_1828037 [Choiromyces venosus 120613-1]